MRIAIQRRILKPELRGNRTLQIRFSFLTFCYSLCLLEKKNIGLKPKFEKRNKRPPLNFSAPLSTQKIACVLRCLKWMKYQNYMLSG